MEISEIFKKGIEAYTYRRVDPDYKVNVFLGYNDDGNMSMIITEKGKEERVSPSKIIDVQIRRREDHKLSLSFNLLDSAYAPMFMVFCKDMIIVCERAGREKAISVALLRWKYWKEMFKKKSSQLLEKNEIKGLIGELNELKCRLIPEYGIDEAIESWRGPLLGHKDYEIENTWYEVKTINDGAVHFTVSSLEQLDSDVDGHLIIVKVVETSGGNKQGTNLNELVLQITDMIEDPELLDCFRTKLENVGYTLNSEYDNVNYIIKGSDVYSINDSFPRIRRRDISNSIGNAKYSVVLAGITNFKE